MSTNLTYVSSPTDVQWKTFHPLGNQNAIGNVYSTVNHNLRKIKYKIHNGILTVFLFHDNSTLFIPVGGIHVDFLRDGVSDVYLSVSKIDNMATSSFDVD